MIKRILFTLMTLLALYSLAVLGYRIYEPDLHTEDTSNYIPYNSLREYTLSQTNSTRHVYFFYSSTDDNSNYVLNTLFPSINSQKKKDYTSVIEIIDISSLESSFTTNRLKSEWGIQTYPSFLLVSVENDEISIDSTLCWEENTPFTTDTIINWLAINNITNE